MEIGLEGLIDRIKKDGIEEADKKAKDIILEAEKKAKDIKKRAEDQSVSLLDDAQSEIAKLKKQADESIRQAVRDNILILQQKITEVFDKIVKREVSAQLDTKAVLNAIVDMIEHFKKGGTADIEILVSEKDKEHLEKSLLDALTREMQKGVTIKLSPDLEKGFLIGKKGDNYYYDFSGGAIAEAFKKYLNPKVRKMLE